MKRFLYVLALGLFIIPALIGEATQFFQFGPVWVQSHFSDFCGVPVLAALMMYMEKRNYGDYPVYAVFSATRGWIVFELASVVALIPWVTDTRLGRFLGTFDILDIVAFACGGLVSYAIVFTLAVMMNDRKVLEDV